MDLLIELMLKEAVLKLKDVLLISLDVASHQPFAIFNCEKWHRNIGLDAPSIEELFGYVHLYHFTPRR